MIRGRNEIYYSGPISIFRMMFKRVRPELDPYRFYKDDGEKVKRMKEDYNNLNEKQKLVFNMAYVKGNLLR